MEKGLSVKALKRLPTYWKFLAELPGSEDSNVSARIIAEGLGLREIQVRKDLAALSAVGRPKVGYVKKDLMRSIEEFFGYHKITNVIMVGAGKLGRALLSYEGFKEKGISIVSAFDVDEQVIGRKINDVEVLPLSKLKETCEKLKVKIGIITVPEENAQGICDDLIDKGILAIWNFAPIHLIVPDHILLKNENLATSLTILSKQLEDKIN